MRVPDEMTKCVGFLYVESGAGARPIGTAFMIGVDGADGGVWVYFVTARHVVEAARNHSMDGQLYVRLNLRAGGVTYLATRFDFWYPHPTDPAADVSVWAAAPSPSEIDYLVYPRAAVATDAAVQQNEIGVGDEVFVTGLFANHSGADRNLPIVRIGNIAAMPSEPIATSLGPAEGYLIEARSIGGLSGSPVFANLMGVRTLPGSLRIGGPRHFLLGLIHGHWDLRPSPAPAEVPAGGLGDEVVNMGIAIVVPASKILETIDQPVFQAQREGQLAVEPEPT